MKTLVVGDLHGQHELVTKALDMNMPTIFLGDYLDSFDVSVQDQVTTLVKVLNACEEREDVTALTGNHEMSYLSKEMACSGYKAETQMYVNLLENLMHKHLEPYTWAEGFLLSHAGVSLALLRALEHNTAQEYLDADEFNQIGAARGGLSPSGGLYWCDWGWEFKDIPGTPQIVGHTRGRGIRRKGNSYCIDCLEDQDPHFITIENGVAEPLEINKEAPLPPEKWG